LTTGEPSKSEIPIGWQLQLKRNVGTPICRNYARSWACSI
jgi:hypothetical protein